MIVGQLNGNGSSSGGSGLLEIQAKRHAPHLVDRGDDQLAKFLVMQQLFPAEDVTNALETVTHLNKDLTGQALRAFAAG